MIKVDIDMPKSCLECPMCYRVQFGQFAFNSICNAMNHKGVAAYDCLVDTAWIRKPKWCPIREVYE